METWTGGHIQPIFARINRSATTYARHNVILCEDKKVDIVVEIIKDTGLLAADCSSGERRTRQTRPGLASRNISKRQ